MKRPPMKEPQAIAAILGKVLSKGGLAKKMVQHSLFDIWGNIVGEAIAKHSRPQKMQGDVLVVSSKSSAWAQELSLMKPAILKKIHEHLPDAGIRDIRFTANTKP